MSEYIVGLDSMFVVTADSPEEAEATLAERLQSGDITPEADDCVTYEELPEGE